jgi:hypothetical protein
MYEAIALFWLCEHFTIVPMFLVIKSLNKILVEFVKMFLADKNIKT